MTETTAMVVGGLWGFPNNDDVVIAVDDKNTVDDSIKPCVFFNAAVGVRFVLVGCSNRSFFLCWFLIQCNNNDGDSRIDLRLQL